MSSPAPPRDDAAEDATGEICATPDHMRDDTRPVRVQWETALDWLTESQGMVPLEGSFREAIVDYLTQTLGPTPPPAPPRGTRLN